MTGFLDLAGYGVDDGTHDQVGDDAEVGGSRRDDPVFEEPVDAADVQDGADEAADGAAGDEARSDGAAFTEAQGVEGVVFAAVGDEVRYEAADEDGRVDFHGKIRAEGKGQGRDFHLKCGQDTPTS